VRQNLFIVDWCALKLIPHRFSIIKQTKFARRTIMLQKNECPKPFREYMNSKREAEHNQREPNWTLSQQFFSHPALIKKQYPRVLSQRGTGEN
jgi:hypothetical protein